MTRERIIWVGLATVTGIMAGLALPGLGGWAQAEELPAAMVAKVKEFKQADARYIKVLCDGPKAKRDEAKIVREQSLDELGKAVADTVAHAPSVQKQLEIATAAGDASDRIAGSADASNQAKADATAKFQKAHDELHDVVIKERSRITDQLDRDFGVIFAARESCPDEPKATSREKKAKVAKKRARKHNESSKAAPASSVSVGFGTSGIGVSFGR